MLSLLRPPSQRVEDNWALLYAQVRCSSRFPTSTSKPSSILLLHSSQPPLDCASDLTHSLSFPLVSANLLVLGQELALAKQVPLHVVFCLVPKFLEATRRQYDFMLTGSFARPPAVFLVLLPLSLALFSLLSLQFLTASIAVGVVHICTFAASTLHTML